MNSPVLPSYHETLYAALAALNSHLIARGIELVNEFDLEMPFQYDGIPYGTHKSADAQIKFVKGKPTKKWGHVTIWRIEGRSQSYEINFYIL